MTSHVQSSSKSLRMVVRSRLRSGEAVDNPISATIAKNVQASGIRNVHQASWSLSVMCALQFAQRV